MKWVVYILSCSNASFYIGHTQNIEARFRLHVAGKGAKHTATYPPEKIVYQEVFSSELEAIRREGQIKRWSRAKKEALIAGNRDLLHQLSKSRD